MKKLVLIIIMLFGIVILGGCETETQVDINKTFEVGDKLAENQPTPTDIDYSLERYNLIRRAYWVNGQREKAINLPCPITKPLGYIVLMTNSGAIIGRFVVDGKVSFLNTWLTPDAYPREGDYYDGALEMPDVDGSYGTKDDAIFFFTTDGKYLEYSGDYLYSDIPFTVNDPILQVGGE